MAPTGSNHHTVGEMLAMAPNAIAPKLLMMSFLWSSASASMESACHSCLGTLQRASGLHARALLESHRKAPKLHGMYMRLMTHLMGSGTLLKCKAALLQAAYTRRCT